jgi:Methylamine utilisation protein MauE
VTSFLQWFLVVVFAGAAAAKLSERNQFFRTLTTLPWLSVRRARFASLAVPSSELLLAVGLVAAPQVGAVAALAALSIFTAVVLLELLSGRDFRCGCFGGAHGTPVGWWTVTRNVFLAAVAGLVIALPIETTLPAGLVGVGVGLVFVLTEVGAETLALARAR